MDESDLVDLDKAWLDFRATGDADLRNQLIEYYLPVVRRTAERMYYSLACKVDVEDLYSAGLLGLIEAISRYRPNDNAKFETFSSQRIRGAMLDDIRSRDWVPRGARTTRQKYRQAYEKLLQKLGRHPSDEELMGELEVGEKEFYDLCMEANILTMVSVQELSGRGGEEDSPEEYIFQDERYERYELARDRREVLRAVIDRLPERKKNILVMYYYEEMTLKEIAKTLDVTEGRISQILSGLLAQLREQLRDEISSLL